MPRNRVRLSNRKSPTAKPETVERNIAQAYAQLDEAGFELPDDFEEWFDVQGAAGFFRASTLWTVFALAEIVRQEKPLTVRRALYRAVSSGIYLNTDLKYYEQVHERLLDMRRREFISYEDIADSTRRRIKEVTWENLTDFAKTVRFWYRKEFWKHMPVHVEVVIEKDAITGVLEGTTNDLGVGLNPIPRLLGNRDLQVVQDLARSSRLETDLHLSLRRSRSERAGHRPGLQVPASRVPTGA
jgi:hypothetical protein